MLEEIFSRSALLVGDDVMAAIAAKHVIIFGVGGVGGWCAEALVRCGVRHLTMVDFDAVSVTNINRQIQATTLTVGLPKVDVLRERLLSINPSAEIVALNAKFSDESAADFHLEQYDVIIDAIDMLKDKIALIMHACATSAAFYSSMGSALKVDPSKVRVAEFWKVRGCPLAAMLRKRMHQRGLIPARPFKCVYDEEVLPNRGQQSSEKAEGKAVINGTLAYITAIFGMTICGLVVQDIYECVAKQ